MLAALAVLALVAGLLAQRWLNPGLAEPERAEPAPVLDGSLVFRDLDGRPRAVEEWKGKVLVVNFWASWCPPCVEEMPEFVRLQEELGQRGLQFIGIAIDEPEAVADFLKQTPVNYPILIGAEDAADWASKLGNRSEVLPFSAVFDRGGTLVRSHTGIFKRQLLLETVAPLLASPAAVTSP